MSRLAPKELLRKASWTTLLGKFLKIICVLYTSTFANLKSGKYKKVDLVLDFNSYQKDTHGHRDGCHLEQQSEG